MVTAVLSRTVELPGLLARRQAHLMSASDRAELSTLRAQLEQLTERVVAVAARYGESADSAIAADLYAAERALFGARRALDRAINALDE